MGWICDEGDAKLKQVTDDSGATVVDGLIAEGLEAAKVDDLEGARCALARAVELDPARVSAWVNYGGICGELGLEEEATKALERARALDPTSREAASNLGVVRREAGRLDEAEALFREVTARSPEFIFGHYNLAHTLFLAGRFAESIVAYRAGLKRDPEKTGSQNARLAWALLASGDVKEARRELRRALDRIGPEEVDALLDEAKDVLAAIETLQPSAATAALTMRQLIKGWSPHPATPPGTGKGRGEEVKQ